MSTRDVSEILQGAISHSTIARLGTVPLSNATRRALNTYLDIMDRGPGPSRSVARGTAREGPAVEYGSGDYQSEDEIAASTIVLDIRSIRRLVTEAADPVTRLSIIQVIEQHYVGRGQKIPDWLEELRRTALS